MKIHLPDKGLVLHFLDDMTEDQMRDAINRNFYPEKLSPQPSAPAAPQPAPAMPGFSSQPAAPALPGVVDEDVVPDVMAPPSTDTLAPDYWDLGTIGKGLLKGIAGLDTRKAERADIETARAFRQSNDPTHRLNLLELGMAANKAVGDPNDWNELGYEGLLGALSGGLFGGGGMAVNAVVNAMAKGNAPAATETEAASEAAKDPTFTPEQRGELLRWAHGETGRMAEEAQFAEDGTPENPLSEADLVRYQEIQDAMKRRDYAALSAMRGEAGAQPNLSQSVPSEAETGRSDAAPATVDAPVNAEVNTASNSEGYEQQGAGPARTAPRQAKDSGRPRTKEELDRLGREVEEKMIAAGRDVEEAKAMGLLASEFAHRFAERTGTEAKDALNIEFRRGKAQEKRGAQGKGYAQTSARQSEEYDPGDPKTWPAGQARDEALALEAWQNLENDDEVETWPESPEKTEALGLWKEYGEIEAWVENHTVEEVLANDELNDRGVAIEKRLRDLRKELRKKKPKGAERRLLQLIEAEEEAAVQEAETYYQDRPETTENTRRGRAAMEKVITEQTDVMDAMHRDDLGSISFLWGEPGRGDKFKGGWGVSHLIAHRNAQGYDGEAVARKMVEVIDKGELDKIDSADKGSRAYLEHDGHTAVMSLYRNGERQTWLLTGWEDYKEKAPGEIGPVYDGLNPTLSEATRFRPEEGAGAKTKPHPGAPSEGDGSTGTTLSGPMRARPEEGAGASDNSKPPVSQKSKRESAPNGRTYFLPDGTSIIDFFEAANKSTSFHEFGHHILNKMMESSGLEGVDPQLVEDVKTILDGAGVSREAFDANMEYALRHYLNLSARYIAMDTLKHDGINLFERAFGRFDNDYKGLARYTKDYINDVLGVPSNVEQTLSNWVRNSWLGKYLPNVIGDRPVTVAANSIASLVAHCKLGFLNVASAAMNLSQLNGTQAIIGPIWTARALAEYLHPNQTTLRLYADAGEGMRRRGAGGGESTAYERAMRGARTPRRHEDYRSMQNYAGMWN